MDTPMQTCACFINEVRESRRLPPPCVAREIRRAADVTQERLARELGVHRVTVARWEAGSRRPRGALRQTYAILLEEMQREVMAS